jgi:hypothetical protein
MALRPVKIGGDASSSVFRGASRSRAQEFKIDTKPLAEADERRAAKIKEYVDATRVDTSVLDPNARNNIKTDVEGIKQRFVNGELDENQFGQRLTG